MVCWCGIKAWPILCKSTDSKYVKMKCWEEYIQEDGITCETKLHHKVFHSLCSMLCTAKDFKSSSDKPDAKYIWESK